MSKRRTLSGRNLDRFWDAQNSLPDRAKKEEFRNVFLGVISVNSDEKLWAECIERTLTYIGIPDTEKVAEKVEVSA